MRPITMGQAQWKAESADGESLSFELCRGGYFSDRDEYGLRVVGKTAQTTLTGKNLWNNADTEKGNGTTVTETGFDFDRGDFTGGTYVSCIINCKSGVKYTFSCKRQNGNTSLYVYQDKVYGTRLQSTTASALTYTAAADGDLVFAVMIDSSTASEKITDIQVEIGSAVTEYEPYCGGIPSPNPDYPQPIKCVKAGTKVKSVGGSGKLYGVLWDKVNAKCTRLFDAAEITDDTSSFGHFGSENASYSNPFDNIYPWCERKLCNYSIAAFTEIVTDGYDVRDAVVAWEGDADFSLNPEPGIGVGVYTPPFWHISYDVPEGRVFAVSADKIVGGVYAEATIGGRWFGTAETVEIDGEEKTVLGCRPGVPSTDTAMSTLHTYAKNGGMTLEDIWTWDAETILMVVEYANMNSQSAIGDGCSNLYIQSNDKVQAAAENTNVIKVLASMSSYCIPGAIIDIGTTNGGRQIANRYIVSAEVDADNSTLLNVTISGDPITVTTDTYWSIHGCANAEDEIVGSHSGYLGTNSKCSAYYRGRVAHANLFRYVLGAYRQTGMGHLWVAKSRTQAENYDAINTTAHIDTGIVFHQGADGAAKEGFIKNLAITPGLSVPPFCDEVGGNSSNPVGDYCYVPTLTAGNTVLRVGGNANSDTCDGRLYGYWVNAASHAYWGIASVPFSKSADRNVETAFEPENELTVPCDLYEGDVWYPMSGNVERNNGIVASYSGENITGAYKSTTGGTDEGAKIVYKLAEPIIEQYDPQPIFAPSGTVNVNQTPTELEAELGATVLTRR